MRAVVREVFVALLLLLSVAPAWAESPEETQARVHYAQGQRQFDAGHFAAALAAYERSYVLSPYPAILYKIALCRDLLGQRQEALSTYREYLGLEALSERRATVESRIKELSGPPAVATVPREPPEPPGLVAPPVVERSKVPPAAPAAAPVARKRSRLWIVGVAVGAAAAIGLGVGLGVGLSSGDSVRAATYGTIAVR